MSYKDDFESRSTLLNTYGNNALLLYALELRFEIADIFSVAGDALTDGGEDKKCDLIYIDQDTGIAVIAQGYMKQKVQEGDLAPENKASDLNTAAAWVFSQEPESVPERIRDQVRELQNAIKDDLVSTVYFWYVHNLNEKNNPKVREELTAMQINSNAAVKTLFPENKVDVFAIEVGNETIEKWYNASSSQITVVEKMTVDTVKKGFELVGDKWKAYVTAVTADWVKEQYCRYNDDIFSGNPRTYLGSGKKKNKINLGIIQTITEQPNNFWAYNNGITALVNDYSIENDLNTGEEKLTISGITIINGAQTTGAVSSVTEVGKALIPIRFIVCEDSSIIDEIINNNNKQNEIIASDLRSKEILGVLPGQLQYPSLNEVNYIAFNEVTEEYHDELYSFIEFQGWKNLYVQGKPTRLYKRIGKTGSIINEQKVLTEYIRHQIHHPENQNNPRYTREELKQSIDLMRIFIEQQSTGGISEP